MLKATFFAACLTGLLTSCGGIRHYLHNDVPAPAGQQLAPVAMNVGESVNVVKHTPSIMAGGYIEGLWIEDPSIAEIRYGKDGRGDRFDSLVRILGLRPGTTRAAYGNRLGDPPNYIDPDTGRLLAQSFLIHVVDPGFALKPADFKKSL